MFMSGFKDFNPSRQEGSLEFLTSSDQIQMFGDKTRHKTVTLSQKGKRVVIFFSTSFPSPHKNRDAYLAPLSSQNNTFKKENPFTATSHECFTMGLTPL